MPATRTNAAQPGAWRRHFPVVSRRRRLAAGWEMAYVDEPAAARRPGDGVTLLFVHGNPTWSFHWRRLIARHAGVVRCVAPDHIGCGRSEKPPVWLTLSDRIAHLVELIEGLQLCRVVLVAQDWGGAIGLGALLARPDCFAGVLLLNTGAFRPRYIPRRIALCKAPGLGRLALQGGNLFSRAAVRMATTRRLSAETARGYLSPYGRWRDRRAVHGFVRDIPRGPSHPTWRVLGGIEDRLPELAGLPTSLVWGMKDWCFTPACLDRFLQAWPHAEATRLPDAGHWGAVDAHEATAAALDRLLGRIAAGVPTGGERRRPAADARPA